MSKCSHEGHMPGHAVKHLHKMHKEHGHPDHKRSHSGGNQSRPGENKRFEREMERDERKDG